MASLRFAAARALAFAISILPAWSSAAAGESVIRVSAEQQRLLEIKSAPVEKATELVIDGAAGEVVLPVDRSSAVTAMFAGRLTKVAVDEGDTVHAGQELARVASREYASEWARLVQVRADRDVASRQAQRDKVLLAEGIIPASRAEASRAHLRALDAELKVVEQTVEGLAGEGGNALTYVLRAPVDGRVISRRVAVGEPIESMGVAFVIAQRGGYRLDMRVPAAVADQIEVGDTVVVGKVTAKVTGRGAALDPATQTVVIRAELPADAGLLPGQRVIASLRLRAPEGALRVPRAAVVMQSGESHVYVAAGEGAFRAVPVTVLGQDATDMTVQGPLSAGDAVVVSGVSALKSLASEKAGE